jgi:hypothetical protein
VSKRIGVVPDRQWVWVTSTADGADHAVTDAAMTAGLVARQGLFLALCGTGVTAAALVTPPGQRCAQYRHSSVHSQHHEWRRRGVG